jgi:pimeloyl-ACP methyl ester carboxylesterase
LLPPTFDAQPSCPGLERQFEEPGVCGSQGHADGVVRHAGGWSAEDGVSAREGRDRANAQLNLSSTCVGFSHETTSDAPEAYFMGLSGGAPVRVSRAKRQLAETGTGETKVIHWKGKDGREMEGLLTYPAGYEAGKKYPLILNIHGGPAGVFAEPLRDGSGCTRSPFRARGYAVLRPNPRGSSGYGKRVPLRQYRRLGRPGFRRRYGGVDQVIAMGVADPDHLAVMGWSYGGFMTSWVVTHTNRFKAAVVGAGVTDCGASRVRPTFRAFFRITSAASPGRSSRRSPAFARSPSSRT